MLLENTRGSESGRSHAYGLRGSSEGRRYYVWPERVGGGEGEMRVKGRGWQQWGGR